MRLLSLLLLLLPAALLGADAARAMPTSFAATAAYYCEEPKEVQVGSQGAATPRVCFPAP